MIKYFLLLFLFTNLLFAQEATQEQLNSIYQEALLFIAVFGVMGILSYIYSTRHAKEYVPKEPTQEEIDAKAFRERRVKELAELLEKNVVTKTEYEILHQHYKSR